MPNGLITSTELTEAAGLHRVYNGPRDTFYDAQTHGPLRMELRRITRSRWQLLRRFGYHDSKYPEPFVCPHDVDEYDTDMASQPWFFQWVVPARGTHFPAIMLHDALVAPVGKPSHLGPPVTREEADRIMRDAMKALGVGVIRRWLAWTGAFAATISRHKEQANRAVLLPLLVITLGVVAVLGVLATVDLFDGARLLPWMGDRPFWQELIYGAIAAIITPAILSILWGRRWRFALIAGLALAVLLHVTIVLLGFFAVYWVFEHKVLRGHIRSGQSIAADQELLEAQMRVAAQVGKGSATYIDLRIPRSSIRISITGPQMLVSGLRMVTDLGILDGHDHPALVEVAAKLEATSYCGRVGPAAADIRVDVDRQGAALTINAGPMSMYESVLEIRTVSGETFEELWRHTIARHTGRGYTAGLVPIATAGHPETAPGHDAQELAADVSGEELDDASGRELAHGHA